MNVIIFVHYRMKFEEISMVNWKIALIVVIIVALVMAVGMWFGYRYVSEQDDLSPEGWRERSNMTDLPRGELFVLVPTLARVTQK